MPPKPVDGYTPYANPLQDVGGGNYLSENATPGAFGAQVGIATEDASKKTEDLVNHFNSIYDDSSARNAVTSGSKQLADMEFELKSARGNDAIPAYKDFQKKAQDLSENLASSMPSAQAKEMFRRQFSSEVNGAIFRSGGYAGEQAEHAQVQSYNDAIANSANLMGLHATDPNALTSDINNIRDNATQYSHFLGLDAATADRLVSHNVGEGAASAIRGVIQSDPDKAKELYNQFTQGKFTVDRQDSDGTMAKVDVPYLDAAHRVQIESEMNGEFRRQEGESLQTARNYATQGVPFDEGVVRQAMQNTGRTQDYQDAEIGRLNMLQKNTSTANTNYVVSKSLVNAQAMAQSGLPLSDIPSEQQIDAAYTHEPDKAADIKRQFADLYHVSAFVGQLPTQTPAEATAALQSLRPEAPSAPPQSSDVINNIINKHEGGYVAVDGASGAPAIYGINQKWHPEEYAAAKELSDTKGDAAGREYAQTFYKKEYWDKNNIGDLKPEVQSIVMDGVINHSTAFSSKLLQAAKDGESPQQLIDMRRKEYTRLAQDTNYAPNLPAWNDRLDDLQKDSQQNSSSDYANKLRLYNQTATATQKYFKGLYSDPSGKILSSNALMTDMLNDSLKDQDPASFSKYISSMQVQQERMQVPEQYRSVLPTATATTIANNIVSNPENAPTVINQWAKKSGDNWPVVFKSLVTQGKLPPYYQSVAQLGQDPSTERDGELLAKWRGGDNRGKTDDDIIGAKPAKDMKDAIGADLRVQQLMRSLALSGSSPAQVDDVKKSIESLAFAKSFYDKSASAVEDSVSAFTSKYEFMPNGGARVPSENFDVISRNANQMLLGIEKLASAPPIATTGYHGLPNEASYYNAVRANPTWITSNNSIKLIDPFGRFVMGKNGKPLSIPFDAPMPSDDNTVSANPLGGAM